MKPDTTVRAATELDAMELAHVLRNAWRATYRGVMTDEYLDGLDVERMATNWGRTILRPDEETVHLVAETRGKVVGFASLGRARESETPKAGQLYAINVDPDAWGQGVGSTLFAAAEHALAESGYEQAYLWVEQGNERAIRFYTERGWLDDGGTLKDTRFDPPVSERRHSREFTSAARKDPAGNRS
jgi:Acetyltransferases